MLLSVTTSLIAKRNLGADYHQTDHDNANDLRKLSHVRLDRENISKLENLELLSSVTNLYLQHVS